MAWISVSEFVRNQFLIQEHWVAHYDYLGLIFPAEPINGAVWGIWSLVYAISLYFVNQRFNLFESFALGWTYGFLMMWLVLGNLSVLPWDILPIAFPLSLLESFVACWLIQRINKKPQSA